MSAGIGAPCSANLTGIPSPKTVYLNNPQLLQILQSVWNEKE